MRQTTGRRARLLIAALAFAGLTAACDSAEERLRSHYERGVALAEAGESPKAVVEFMNALRIDDAFAPAHHALGRALQAQGDDGRAAGHFAKAAELEPSNVDARVRLARIRLNQRDAETAAAQARAALEIDPENVEALAIRASADMLLGHDDEAVVAARAALALDPSAHLARVVLVSTRLRNGDTEGALAELRAAPPAVGADALELGLIEIGLLERLGDPEAAGAILTELAGDNPDNTGLAQALARWRLAAGDRAGAEAALRDASARRPDELAPKLEVVDFLRQVDGADAAQAELERLLAAAEAAGRADDRATLERAMVMLDAASGERDAAVSRLRSLIEAGGDAEIVDDYRVLLARLLDPAVEGPQVAELVDDVLERDPTNVGALVLRAERALRADRYDTAVQDFRAALQGAPDDPQILERLAAAHERAGAPALASRVRAGAVEASGYASGPSIRFARQLLAEDKADSAESVTLSALQKSPQDAELLRLLADIRLRSGDEAGAAEVARALEAAHPGDAARIRAQALTARGEVEAAVARLDEAWSATGDPAVLDSLIGGLQRLGRFEEAESILSRRLEDAPEDVAALSLLAGVQSAAARPEDAERTLERAIALAPEQGSLHIAMIGLRARAGDEAGARAAHERGLAAAPDHVALNLLEAQRLDREGRQEDVIAIFERLYEAHPDDLLVANNLASALSDYRNDPESVARAATVAQRLRSSDVPIFQDTFGWTLHLTGESAQAVSVLRASAEALPEAPVAQYHLGAALAAIGESDLARERLQAALSLADAGAPFPQRDAAEDALAALEEPAVQ